MHLGGAPKWYISPQSQPQPSGNEPAARPCQGGGQLKFAALALTQICLPWTGIWPRTLSSVTVTSSGWRTSCAPTPSRPVGPAVPAPGASPTSASGRSRARSSGAQVVVGPLSVCSLIRDAALFPGWLQQGCPRPCWIHAGRCWPPILGLGMSGVQSHPLCY